MAYTQDIEIPKDSWHELEVAGSYVAIQLNESGSVKVHMADEAPDNSNETGIYVGRLQSGVPGSFAAGGIQTGTRVFVRSAKDETETITVLSY